MINNELAKNWEAIVNFNSKIEITDNPIELTDKVKIPLTPIEINAYLLYYLFQEFYPKFINDQLNVIDLIISDYEIDNIVLGAYLYNMNKPGIHENIKEIDVKDFKLKFKDLDNRERLLSNIQSSILKKYGKKITNFRILRKRGLDLINRHMENKDKSSFSTLIGSLLDLTQTLIENNLFIFYPQPPIINFLKEFYLILKNIKISQVYHYFSELISNEHLCLVLKTKVNPIALNWKKSAQKNKSDAKELSISWIKINEKEQLDLEKTRLELNCQQIISIDLLILINYFIEIVESSFPISQEKLKLLLQKFFFGVRTYQTHWDISPPPLFSNFLVRYLLKIFGIDFNLNKLSHWAIPEFIFSIINPYGGIVGKILLILSDRDSKSRNKTNFILLNFENGTIISIEKMQLPESELDLATSNLTQLRIDASKNLGFLSSIIKIDKKLLQYFIEGYLMKIHKFNIFKLVKLIKLLKNPLYFEVNPPIPIYTLIRSKGIYTLIKKLLWILIDKHNF